MRRKRQIYVGFEFFRSFYDNFAGESELTAIGEDYADHIAVIAVFIVPGADLNRNANAIHQYKSRRTTRKSLWIFQQLFKILPGFFSVGGIIHLFPLCFIL